MLIQLFKLPMSIRSAMCHINIVYLYNVYFGFCRITIFRIQQTWVTLWFAKYCLPLLPMIHWSQYSPYIAFAERTSMDYFPMSESDGIHRNRNAFVKSNRRTWRYVSRTNISQFIENKFICCVPSFSFLFLILIIFVCCAFALSLHISLGWRPINI